MDSLYFTLLVNISGLQTHHPHSHRNTQRQHSPPHVAALGKRGGLDDFGGHPSVGASSAHLGGLVPLSGQAEVSDLQRQTLHTFVLYGLSQEDWRGRERERRKRKDRLDVSDCQK